MHEANAFIPASEEQCRRHRHFLRLSVTNLSTTANLHVIEQYIIIVTFSPAIMRRKIQAKRFYLRGAIPIRILRACHTQVHFQTSQCKSNNRVQLQFFLSVSLIESPRQWENVID